MFLASLAVGAWVGLGVAPCGGATMGSGGGGGGGSGGGFATGGGGGGGSGGGGGGVGGPGHFRPFPDGVPPGLERGGNANGGGAAGGGGGMIGLAGREAEDLGMLQNPIVRRDLALTPAQEARCRAALMRVGHANARSMKMAGGAPPDPRRVNDPNGHAAWMNSLRQAEQISRAAVAEMLASLTPAQKRRLDEIRVQGPAVLMQPDPEVANALGLSESQRQRLRDIVEDHQRQVRDLMPTKPTRVFERNEERRSADGRTVERSTRRETETRLTPGQEEEYHRRFSEILAEQRRQLEAVLTPEQQARLSRMRGRPLPKE